MDTIKILSDLIRIDTSNPPGNNYEKIIDYLEPLFASCGCQTQKIFIPKEFAKGQEGRVNLLAHRRNLKKPRLIFYTHIDVVPAKGWDAFNPRIENGKLFGRGAADMKGAIPPLLLALEKTKESTVKYDISVMVTTDEETDQIEQLDFLSQFLEPLKGAYIFDLDTASGYVNIAGLGDISLKLKVKGKSVHSASSHLGVNAIEKAVLLQNAILKLKKKVEKRRSKTRVDPATGLEKLESRLSITVIKGGLKSNIIPDECFITVDRRLIPEEDLQIAEKELIETLKSVKGVDWEIIESTKMPTTLTNDPITDKLAQIIEEVTGKSGKYGIMGSGDFFQFATKCRAVLFGVGVMRTDKEECHVHGKDEYVYLKDIDDLAEIIKSFLTK